jgi:hypothetical protein
MHSLACIALVLGCVGCSLPAASIGASARWARANRGDLALGANAWRVQVGLGWRSSRPMEPPLVLGSDDAPEDAPDGDERAADPPCHVAAACAWALQAERDALSSGGPQ